MNEKIPISLKIAEREYKLRVAPEEEAQFRAVGKSLNEGVQNYRKLTGVNDLTFLMGTAAISGLYEAQKALYALEKDCQSKVQRLVGLNEAAEALLAADPLTNQG